MDGVLEQLVAWSLTGATRISSPPDLPAALELVDAARHARLLGPLLQAEEAGAVTLPPGARDRLVHHHRAAQRWCLLLEHRLLEVRRWFAEDGGITHLVLKGPAIAHLDEDDPADRSFADIDLLVAADDLDRGVAALVARGGERPWVERRPGYDRRFAKSVTVTFPDGIEVDVHRSLSDGAHGFRVPLDRLFADATTFPLGGEEVACLSLLHRFLHAAWHAVLGSPSPRLSSLRDLGRHLLDPGLSPDVVVPEVEQWRGRAVLAAAIDEALGRLDLEAPAWCAWADAARPTISPREAAIVARQRVEGSGLGRGKVDAMRELPVSQRLAYAAGLLVPARAHLRSRGMRWRDLAARVSG
jgi:hypothetical protein